MQNLKARLKKLSQDTKEYVEAWLAEEEKWGESKVNEFLNHHKKQIILGILGFNNKWHEWEVSSSQFDPKSPVLDFIRQSKAVVIQNWLSEQFGKDLPKLSAKAQKSLKDYYEDQLMYSLREKIRARVEEDSRNILDSSLGKELQETCNTELLELLEAFKKEKTKVETKEN